MNALEISMDVLEDFLSENNNIIVLALLSCNLYDIPLQGSLVVRNIEHLRIPNNKITGLKDDSFLEYVNLTEIDLINNRISHISKYSLASLVSLTAVYLLDNPLKFLDIVLSVLQTQHFNYFFI